MGQESDLSLIGSPVPGFRQAEIKISAGAAISSEAQLGKGLLPSSLRLLAKFTFSRLQD